MLQPAAAFIESSAKVTRRHKATSPKGVFIISHRSKIGQYRAGAIMLALLEAPCCCMSLSGFLRGFEIMA